MRIMKRIMCIVLSLTALLLSVVPCAARAAEPDRKVVRVGWFDSSYNIIDEQGYRSGYGYEYQLKLAAYNGWSYEYVEGSWPELLKKLETGEIDLLSDVSFTEKRAEKMLFPSIPMGTEEYYLFALPGGPISNADKSTLNGKKVGVNAGSVQAKLYEDWAAQNGIQSELIPLTGSEDNSLKMLSSGGLDAYVTVDSFVDARHAVPEYKIGSSDYFFAVTASRPDLLEDLEYAMSMIQDENRYYNTQLYEKYIRRAGANAFLSRQETEWLSAKGKIRVGYQQNYMAFCDTIPETGELTGVLKDFLILAADCMPNAHLEFETIGYPTNEAAMLALRAGEIDCVFPANLSSHEAELSGTVMTPPLITTEMYAVVRIKDPNIFAKTTPVVVAVNEGNQNYEAFLAKNFPDWEKEYFENSEECLKGVSAGKADCLIISNYRYNNLARLCEKNRLTTLSLGVVLDYCFAVNKGQTELYSVLAKVTSMVPDTYVNSAMTHYVSEDAKLTFTDVLVDHLPLVMTLIALVVLTILTLLIMNIRAVKRAKRLISATERDDLTGLYGRKYFFQYANRMHQEHPDRPMDAIVLNIEQFHAINDLHGRKLGDEMLRVLGNEIFAITRELRGIAGRFDADRFDIYSYHLESHQRTYERLQARLDKDFPTTNARLRMGVMPWQKGLEPVQLFDRAQIACKMARGLYNKPLIVYDETVREREKYEQRLANDLRRALDAREFEVYFQPKFDIQAEPPKLASAEALVRWHHAELGMIPPNDFIPLFEKNGQISLLDKYVWREAARQVAEWKGRYGVTVPVSVNLSRIDVFDPALPEILEEILRSNGLEHTDFNLEVTESAYTENAYQVIQVIKALRERGFRVEMDDFGSGYSSLNMLSTMPVDVLKMDREFIRNVDHEEKDQHLVALILDIAKSLKVIVIAEGVEREAQLQFLKKLGCEMVQGYYFSRPLPAAEFEKNFLITAPNRPAND